MEDIAADDFAGMIREHWKRLPANAVIEAINAVLKDADPDNQRDGDMKINNVGVLSAQTTVSFRSVYEYRLFELIPILKEVDSSAAEDYLKKYREVASALKKYPEGQSSPDSLSDGNSQGTALSSSLTDGAGNPGMRSIEFQRAQEIVAMAEGQRFDDAIANASSISDDGMRAACFEEIAHLALKQKPGIAEDAIEKMMDASGSLRPHERIKYYIAAAGIYSKLNDPDSAEVALEKGIAAAGSQYKNDSDADNPNRAMKAFWPATNEYCSLLQAAADISPLWATTLLRQIQDPDIKAAASSSLADRLLAIPAASNPVLIINRNGATFSDQ